MIKDASKCLGKDKLAKGKYKPTYHNTLLLVVSLLELLKDGQLSEIPGAGRLLKDTNGSFFRFVPYRPFSKALLNDCYLDDPDVSDYAFKVIQEKTGLLEQDILLGLSSLTTHILDELKEKKRLVIPDIGTIETTVIVTNRPRITFRFTKA